MRIPIHVSPDRPEPMYHQIEEQLRSLILSGQLEEGAPIPSIREFAAQLSCSIITIRRVFQDLENEGFLRTRQGRGTFVANVGREHKEQYRLDAVYEAFREAVRTALRVHCGPDDMRSAFEQVLREETGHGPPEGEERH